MKVKFANCEIDVWKLKRGVVLGCGSQYVHLEGIMPYTQFCSVLVRTSNGGIDTYSSERLDWLEPH